MIKTVSDSEFEKLTKNAIADMTHDKQSHIERPTNGFTRRVVKVLLKDGWNIQYSNIPGIDLFSVRPGVSMKKAYRVKAHGRLSHKEWNWLQEFGKQSGMHVLYIHEVSNRGIEFIRVFPRD